MTVKVFFTAVDWDVEKRPHDLNGIRDKKWGVNHIVSIDTLWL
jgi:hypothetical protein